MNNQKFKEFLKIAKQLNEQEIIPLLMGSLGLEYVTERDWHARDIDIHVSGDARGWEAPDDERIYRWNRIVDIMTNLHYRLIDLHEHEFFNGIHSVEFGVKETLPEFAGVPIEKLTLETQGGVSFYIPSKEQFLSIYQASAKDSYRADHNNHKDLAKIAYLESLLKING